MALYIFSDAHLGSGSPELEARKVEKIAALCDKVRQDGDRLIILGDLFDFWFEYKHAMPKDQFDVLYLLRGLRERNISIDYVSGNHDFWMGDFFESQLGIAVHRDSLELSYAGRMILCIHGDGLAERDRGYRFLKRVLRNPVNIWLYRKLPADWAIPLAKRVSGHSREHTARRDHDFAADYEQYAETQLRNGFDIVAIGHLHIPVYKTSDVGTYINTGDFIHHFSYARIDSDGAELLYL